MATELEELEALDAAGALDEAEQGRYRERLTAASPEQCAAIAQLYDLAAHVAISQPLTPLPDGSRDRLLTRLDRADSDDGMLATDTGAEVLLVVSPADYRL